MATNAVGNGRWSVDNIRDPYLLDGDRYVVDYLEYVTLDDRDKLDVMCSKLYDEVGLNPAIVILDDAGSDISEFASQLFRNWRISNDNRGFLVLISAKSQKWVVVSNSDIYTEEILTKIAASTIEPSLRQNNIYDGISGFIAELHKKATGEYGLGIISHENNSRKTSAGIDLAIGAQTQNEDEEFDDYEWATHEDWKPENLIDPFTIDSTNYVCDPLHYLKTSDKRSLDSICNVMNHHADIEMAVVILDHITMEPFDFGLQLYNRWGLGRQDRGLLVLIVIEDHQWQFNTGYGIEGTFPDALLGRVGNSELVPEFRNERYYEGIRNMLEVLYNVATKEGYGDAYYANSAGDDDVTTEDVMIVLFIFILLCGVSNSMGHNGRKSLKDINASYHIKNKTTLYYKSNVNDISHWSIWGGHGWLRLFLIDISFVGTIFMAEGYTYSTYSFTNMALVLYPYFIYQCFIWFVVASCRIHADNNDASIVARTQTIINSGTVKAYKLLVPFIAFPAVWMMKASIRRHTSKAVKCPTCQGKLKPSTEQYIPDSDVRRCEISHNIILPSIYTCDKQHRVTVINHGSKYNNYSDCKACDGHTLEWVRATTKVAATYTSQGTKEVEYRCIACGHTETVIEAIPKLVAASSSGYSGSGGSRSYSSSSGGSRGGGRSGGGGAGGRW